MSNHLILFHSSSMPGSVKGASMFIDATEMRRNAYLIMSSWLYHAITLLAELNPANLHFTPDFRPNTKVNI
jgi:hypothetical protein